MCGIAGVVGSHPEGDVLCIARRMTQAIKHRGPDGAGIKSFGADELGVPVALGHRRLAIIDLSDAGLQPMCNEDETIWIVFNGEIYNFQELRHQLQANGHVFKSATDSEVILHLFEECGPQVVQKLVGMFAFAILDKRTRTLVLARDQLGIKPLYYEITDRGLRFGSEIKALLSANNERPSPNWQAIYDYFTFLYVPTPSTAFEGIQQLPPAHVLVYDIEQRTHRISEYWKIGQFADLSNLTTRQLEERLFEELGAAVHRELVSDVPLGIFLSGGIDSSVLAGLAARAGVQPRTFTVDFSTPETRYYSEARAAEETSRYLATEHRTLTVNAVNPIEMLGLIDYFDQPFGNPTFYLQWLISKHAREHITVALNGAGGDELFGGYPRYRAASLARMVGTIPGFIRRGAERSLSLLRDTNRSMALRRAREFLSGIDGDPVRQFTNWTYYLTTEEKQHLLRNQSAQWQSSDHYLRQFYNDSPFRDGNRLLHVDLRSFLVDNLLEYTDRMSMANGMEIRVPMLEPDFVSCAMSVPFHHKLRRGRSKIVLRDAFAQYLTPTVREGAKRGFNAPLGLWMRGELDQYFVASQADKHPLKDVLGDDIGAAWRDDQILNWRYINEMRAQHRAGRQDLSHELFSVIVFDVWWRKYMTGTLAIEHWSST